MRRSGHGVVDFRETHAAANLVLTPEHHGRLSVTPSQQVLGEVQPRVGEPLRTRHLVAIDQYALTATLGDYAAEIPGGSPELLRFPHRPVVELLRIPDPCIPALVNQMNEARDVGVRNALLRRLPENVSGRCHELILPKKVKTQHGGTEDTEVTEKTKDRMRWQHARNVSTGRQNQLPIPSLSLGILVLPSSVFSVPPCWVENALAGWRSLYSGRIWGNRMTSRMLGLSVNSMTRRSMPMPSPAVGGNPYSRARI